MFQILPRPRLPHRPPAGAAGSPPLPQADLPPTPLVLRLMPMAGAVVLALLAGPQPGVAHAQAPAVLAAPVTGVMAQPLGLQRGLGGPGLSGGGSGSVVIGGYGTGASVHSWSAIGPGTAVISPARRAVDYESLYRVRLPGAQVPTSESVSAAARGLAAWDSRVAARHERYAAPQVERPGSTARFAGDGRSLEPPPRPVTFVEPRMVLPTLPPVTLR